MWVLRLVNYSLHYATLHYPLFYGKYLFAGDRTTALMLILWMSNNDPLLLPPLLLPPLLFPPLIFPPRREELADSPCTTVAVSAVRLVR